MNFKLILFIFVSFNYFALAQLPVVIKDHHGDTNPVINCDYVLDKNHGITLKAEYPLLKSAQDYTVSKLGAFESLGNFTEGTEIKLAGEDTWSEIIDIPFNFCFYGEGFTSFILNDNGMISFDTKSSGKLAPFNIAGNITSGNLSPYTIFGIYHDLTNDPSTFGCSGEGGNCGKITYYITGTAPFRKAVINYNGMNHYNCSSAKSTFQIILNETTNVIDINIKNKPSSYINDQSLSCKGNDIALTGITNIDGKGVAPVGKNNEKWISKEESFRFNPLGEAKPVVEWYDFEGKLIGEGDEISVIPTVNTFYEARAFYNVCGIEFLSGTIPIKFSLDYPTSKTVEKLICFDGFPAKIDYTDLIKESIGTQTGIKTTLHLKEADAIKGVAALSSNIVTVNNSPNTLFLRVEKGGNGACFSVSPLILFSYQIPNIIKDQDVQVCIYNESGSATIHPKNYNALVKGYKPWMDLEYYHSMEDALAEKNPIGYTQISLPSSMPVYIRAFNKLKKDCYTITKATFLFKAREKPVELSLFTCEPFKDEERDLTIFESYYPQYNDLTYYVTELDALTGENPIQDPKSHVVSTGTIIYVRLEQPKEGYCPSISTMKFVTVQNPILNQDKYFCDDKGEGKTTVNLEDYFKQMVGTNKVELDGYYDENDVKINDPKNFLVNKDRIVYVKFVYNGCKFTSRIRIFFRTKIEKLSSFSVCDLKNDGEEIFQLKLLDDLYKEGYTGGVVSYYASAADRDNNKPIAAGTVTVTDVAPLTIYVKVQVVTGCYFYYNIQLSLSNYLFAKTADYTAKICDNNLDGTEIVNLEEYNQYLFKEIVNLDTYKFKYYLTEDDAYADLNNIKNPVEYILEKIPSVIYVRIADTSTCASIVKLIFQNINTLDIKEASLFLCDAESDSFEIADIFNFAKENMLKSSISDVSSISFHKTEKNANENENNTIAEDPTQYPVKTAKDFVWVRFNSKGAGCFTVKLLDINLVRLPKLRVIEHSICDVDLDGKFVIDLEKELKPVVVEDPENYTFSYYLTLDATTPILNYKEFYVDTFPKDIYVKAVNQYGCSFMQIITLSAAAKVEVKPIKTIESCDNNFDGITTFNLTPYINQLTDLADAEFPSICYSTFEDAQKQVNPKQISNYQNVKPNLDQVFVRISSPTHCSEIAVMNLSVLIPPISILSKEEYICPEGEILLNADTGNINDYYQWSTGDKGTGLKEITVKKGGTYWVKITGVDGCSYTYYTQVIEYSKIVIKEIVTGKNGVTVIAEGPGVLEYSMDNINWQESNNFANLMHGSYTFYVRSKSIPCNSVTGRSIIFEFNNIITPNNDGKNDLWELCGLDAFNGQKSHIKIFNRYGKLVFEENSNTCFSWNGYYLGRPLPTSSYWYIINIADGREFTGWILIRNYEDIK